MPADAGTNAGGAGSRVLGPGWSDQISVLVLVMADVSGAGPTDRRMVRKSVR